MNLARRAMLAAALLVAVALVVGAVGLAAGWNDDEGGPVVVRGTLSTEKAGFLNDPEIKRILVDRYDLAVDFTTAGSLEMMADVPAGLDFQWPATPIADDARYDPPPNSDEIFYTPVVLYSWAPVADALAAAGLAQQVDGVLYVTDFPRLLTMIDGGAPWRDIGLGQLDGAISITTTDPTTSNSGSSFAGLLATTFNNGQVVDEATVERVLGRVQTFYARLGPLEHSSGDLFARFAGEGMAAYPIIAGYESSLIEYSRASATTLAPVQGEIRVLYPRPTVWSSHPLIALTPNGEKLLTALKDEEIERLAWEQHGFRLGLFGNQQDPAALSISGVPPTIQPVMPLPRAAVLDRIVAALAAEAARPTTPTTSEGWLRPPRLDGSD